MQKIFIFIALLLQELLRRKKNNVAFGNVSGDGADTRRGKIGTEKEIAKIRKESKGHLFSKTADEIKTKRRFEEERPKTREDMERLSRRVSLRIFGSYRKESDGSMSGDEDVISVRFFLTSVIEQQWQSQR